MGPRHVVAAAWAMVRQRGGGGVNSNEQAAYHTVQGMARLTGVVSNE